MPAIKAHHTPTEDSAWDGPAAVAAMPSDAATLHYCHAWQEDGAGDEKSGYKFPHHRKQGGPANIPACNNGKARLSNANIPAGDKSGVEAHLQAHIDDAGKDDKDGGSDAVTGSLVAMRFPGERSVDMVALASAPGWQNSLRLGQMNAAQRVQAGLPRVQRLSNSTAFHRITDYTDGTPARLDLFDEIGFWGVTANDFLGQLNSIQAPSIELHINSPGGDVWDGIAILNMLRSHNKPIDVVVDGMAASAASFIAQAGDTVTMMPNSQMMIHDAWGMCIGNANDMTGMADVLDKGSQNIATVYATRSGTSADEWRTAMKAETWYSADEAVEAGLADKVGELRRGTKTAADETQPATENHWNLSLYNHTGRDTAPAPQLAATPEPEPDTHGVVLDAAAIRASLLGAFNPTKEARR